MVDFTIQIDNYKKRERIKAQKCFCIFTAKILVFIIMCLHRDNIRKGTMKSIFLSGVAIMFKQCYVVK